MNRSKANPPVVSIDGGIIDIQDSEPLENPPDNSWTHPLTIHVAIRKSDTPGTYLVSANGSSQSSDAITRLEFDYTKKILYVELNVLNSLGSLNSFEHEEISFTPDSTDEQFEVSITKNGKDAGRGGKHAIAYQNVKEPEKRRA